MGVATRGISQQYAVTPEMQGIFTQYYINPVLLNPAFTGISGKYNLFVNYRSNWSNFPGSPKAYTLNYNGPAYDKIGIGALLHSENFGVSNRLRGQLSYAYRFGSDDLKMSLGVSTDYVNYRLNSQALTDGQYDPNDPVILDNVDGQKFFAASIGFYAEYKHKVFFGLALPNVVTTRLGELVEGQNNETSTSYIATVGTWLEVKDYQLTLEPSLYIKKIGDIPLMFDLNLLATFLDDRLYAGSTFSYGAGNRFGFMIGARVNNFRFYYSYDVSYQSFQTYNNGSHELTLAFDLFTKVTEQMKVDNMK